MAQTPSTWVPAEPDLESILSSHEHPLEDLAEGRVPALVIRSAWDPSLCQQLVQLLVEEELLYDPRRPIPAKFQEQIIPEGYYREGRKEMAAWKGASEKQGRARIDIGTSLGYRGSDKEDFFARSAETNALFDQIFENHENPIQVLYQSLSLLSRNKTAITAHESDGRAYGRAIIRAHYGGYTYKPHFDSVRLREKRDEYAVSEFENQFAGVLVLQNSTLGERSAQGIIHRCRWEPEIDPHMKSGTFSEFATHHEIENVEVYLQPGDLYFFNTRMIHEVPGLAGCDPRIVLATFIGYSTDRDEIFVWS